MIERADPKLIQELFDKDPLGLSDQDIDLIIAEFRQDRMGYLQPPVEKAGSKAKASSKAPPAIAVSDDLLKELGL
jgi:hypothetical protein